MFNFLKPSIPEGHTTVSIRELTELKEKAEALDAMANSGALDLAHQIHTNAEQVNRTAMSKLQTVDTA